MTFYNSDDPNRGSVNVANYPVGKMGDFIAAVCKLIGEEYIGQENATTLKAKTCHERYWKDRQATKKNDNVSTDSNDGQSCAETLLTLAKEKVRMIKDNLGKYYAVIQVEGHEETLEAESPRFNHYLSLTYHEKTGKIANAEAVKSVVGLLQAETDFGTKETVDLKIRVAGKDGKIYYDLCNDGWECVEVSSEGLQIIPQPTLFKRNKPQGPQVTPSKTSSADVMDQFLELANVKAKDQKTLLSCHIIACLVPDIQKAVLDDYGQTGSGKTTRNKMIKKIIDPSPLDALKMPKHDGELIQQLNNSYFVVYDNLTHIQEEQSDILCQAVTGIASSKRTLYTNSDDSLMQFKRCIALNGISQVAVRSDLLNRTLLQQHDPIPPTEKKGEQELFKQLGGMMPELLGYIFDVLVKVLKQGLVEVKNKPRMADYATWCETISRCMGNPENAFMDAYTANIEMQTDEAIDNNPIAGAIIELMETQPKGVWLGNPTKLLGELNKLAIQNEIDTKQNPYWPKAAQILSRRLNELAPNLKQKGIMILEGPRSAKGRIIELRKDNRRLDLSVAA